MRIQFACLLLLSTAVLSQDANVGYRNFINRHINAGMSTTRCDSVIGAKGLKAPNGNGCRETHTFIRATTNLVKPICDGAGAPYGNGLRRSLQPFEIVVCNLKSQGRPPHCQYRGTSRTRNIVIRCEQGLPVHFEREL